MTSPSIPVDHVPMSSTTLAPIDALASTNGLASTREVVSHVR
jgi:hypothetical protein